MTNNLLKAFNGIARPRILVLGDLMLDRYTWGNAPRVSPEAPVLVLNVDREEVRLGGAASVAALLRGLDAEVVLAGVVGDDSSGRVAKHLFAEAGIGARLILADPLRPTTTKERFIGRASSRHPHQILRVDRETTSPLSFFYERQLATEILAELPACQAILISDYAKGTCTPSLLQTVIQAAMENNVPVLVDPARSANYQIYRGAAVVKPNRLEASQAAGQSINSPQDALVAGKYLLQQHEFGAVAITLDKEGMTLSVEGQGRVFPTSARTVYDITGAGDMALAMLGLCQASGLELCHSVELANTAAGLQVERLGVEVVTRAEIARALGEVNSGFHSKLVEPTNLPQLASEYRSAAKRIVFTNGCFDLLHVGHVSYLQEAAALGDMLIVGLNSDASVKRLKGPTRPIVGAVERAAMLAALGCVNHVVIFDDDTPHALLRVLRPDVLVKGGTYTEQQVVGREVVDAYGGKVCVVGCKEGVSTSALIGRLQVQQSPDALSLATANNV